MTQRPLAVQGQFYPKSKDELLKYFDHFNNILQQNHIDIDTNITNPKAIIVPHAGYIYSGFTANIAYRYIPKNIKNIIIIGPSHKVAFEGISIALYDSYPCVLSDATINMSLSKELYDRYDFINFYSQAHHEHSTEVQIPFIQYYAPNVQIVEMVYGRLDDKKLYDVIKYLLEDDDNFIVISTDLSHFHNLEKAKKLDNICLKAILQKDIDLLDKGCEACGMLGIKALVRYQVLNNTTIKLLDYHTSADISGDKSSVVGYCSFVMTI